MNWSEAVARLDFEVYGAVEPEPNGRAPGNNGSDGSSAMIDIGVRHDTSRVERPVSLLVEGLR